MLLHASCVAIAGQGVLLAGPPGSGKSDLALRLIDDGAELVADDQTQLTKTANGIYASAPASIAGLLEIRHVGLVRLPYREAAAVCLYVELAPAQESLERLPEPATIFLLDQTVRKLRLRPHEASTPAKIRAALRYTLMAAP